MCASWESWRAALLFEVICDFADLPPRGLPLSRGWGGFGACPRAELCCPGLFSRAFVLLRGLCLHSREPAQLWFYPPSAIFSSTLLICPDNFVGGTVQQDMFTGRGRTALALLRRRCWRNVVCLCFVLHWASAGRCTFCDRTGCF